MEIRKYKKGQTIYKYCKIYLLILNLGDLIDETYIVFHGELCILIPAK